MRYDPYANFRFKVKLGNDYVMACNKVSNTFEFRAEGDPSATRTSPGQTRYDPVTLESGVTCDPTFEAWVNKVWSLSKSAGTDPNVSLKDFRKDIIIEVYDESGQKAIAYKVYRCWVSSYHALPELDGIGNAIAINSITLENEGWERDTSVSEPTKSSNDEPSS